MMIRQLLFVIFLNLFHATASFPNECSTQSSSKCNTQVFIGPRKAERFVFEVLEDGLHTMDGDDVHVHRYIGGSEKIIDSQLQQSSMAHFLTSRAEMSERFPRAQIRKMLDPFLVFDNYRSDNINEYKNGFPAHPHKGMLEIRHFTEGGLHHVDSCERDRITPAGGGQALFAGSGIIHEEKAMESLSGTEVADMAFKGFQIWFNVPKSFKSLPPNYRNVDKFPTVNLSPTAEGLWVRQSSPEASSSSPATVKVIAGSYLGVIGPFSDMIRGGIDEEQAKINPPSEETVKGFLYLDVTVRCGHHPIVIDLPSQQNAIVFMYGAGQEKGMQIGKTDSGNAAFIPIHSLAILGDGDHVAVSCPVNENKADYISFVVATAPPVKERVFIANGFALSSELDINNALNEFKLREAKWC